MASIHPVCRYAIVIQWDTQPPGNFPKVSPINLFGDRLIGNLEIPNIVAQTISLGKAKIPACARMTLLYLHYIIKTNKKSQKLKKVLNY